MSAATGTLIQIGSGVTAWVNAGCEWGASNAALIGGTHSSLLVDTMWDIPRTAEMLEALKPRLAGAPITQLVNTHADGDHWFGNSLVPAPKRVATRSAARAMARNGPGTMRALGWTSRAFRALGRLPGFGEWRVAGDYFAEMVRPYDFTLGRPPLPNFTFSGAIQLDAGRPVQLVELGPAHTRGDLAVLLPEDRILLAGDLVFSGVLPVLWDGSLRNWLRACDWMLSQRVDVVVPGHGPVGDLRSVEEVRAYWQYLATEAHHQYDKGREPALAARYIITSASYHEQPFCRWAGQERTVVNLHAIYRKLMKRRGRLSAWERLMVLKDAALFDAELKKAGGIDRLKPR